MKYSRADGLSGAPERENLAGLVERVTFHNEESGFSVLPVAPGTDETRGDDPRHDRVI